jgi:hypothetical protein
MLFFDSWEFSHSLTLGMIWLVDNAAADVEALIPENADFARKQRLVLGDQPANLPQGLMANQVFHRCGVGPPE